MAEATTSRSVHAHDERSEQVSAATVTIADLASTLGATVLGSSAPSPVSVLSVTHDSRRVVPGALFCCVVGATADGHEFAASAVAAGAVGLLVQHEVDPSTLPQPVPQLLVDDVRSAMAPAAAAVFGHPAQHLRTVGVTGTNGKTTVVSTIHHVLETVGREVRAIGTLTGARTTPEAPDLQSQLADMVESGVTDVAMEVSSHALALHRVDAMVFDIAVFTNLGEDHLDFHETPEAYFAAKAMLFDPEHSRSGIVDVDDVHGRLLIDAAPAGHPMLAVSPSDAEPVRSTVSGSSFRWRERAVTYPLPGRHNVANALLAAEACAALGVDDDRIVAALATMPVVPGRFESVDVGQDFAVVVDFAHTPDALEAVLGTARDLADGGLLVVFGCGGDRDATKRPRMGRVASDLADVVVITSDNPRSEDPLRIIADIRSGCSGEPLVVADRRAAIRAACVTARSGDIVVIAGKGHEQGQDVGGTITPFDDRTVAAEVLIELASASPGARQGNAT
jgi:UDP-N-acetylmuramoyl-L-alanyl-D-glutamate--2,6-diaminopimelate ligase